MLQFLNISNIALIDELQVEFEAGLNLLTGETGSGKSIIVDALGVLIGGRFTSDLLKSGTERGFIEGLFVVNPNPELALLLENAGLSFDHELIIRRELSAAGRNKIFINNQLATQSLLRDLREFLVDIHGQGDQQTLFNPRTHLELLDSFAVSNGLRDEVAEAYRTWNVLERELDALRRDDAEKFQLVDTLRFQIDELERSQLTIGEDERLEEERRRLSNVEKLTELSQASYARIYEDDDAALARVRQTVKDVGELAEYESSFREYLEGLENARAVMEDLSFSLRDFVDKLEFSPVRLSEVEDRLAELSRLKRKYGGTIEAALEHLARSQDRLRQIETSDERERELSASRDSARSRYLDRAGKLHRERGKAAKRFERAVEKCIAELAMEHARFQVQVSDVADSAGPKGVDHVEFYFSANAGEDLKPLARVASGGEASRLMLVLKTVANATEFPRTIVFDEIDSGIGGRVSEAVGIKLRKLAETNQVLCVTHQPQIARFADSHLAVQKAVVDGHTQVDISKLNRAGRIEELARMLTGAEITDAARRHARELLRD
ncbi:MAG TPA: DNA repair protein RecN [Pyrinomonadaceae bacterium]|nr:DNA repair protein RecN [Pyrinomonadaceae bacterium]